MYIREAHAIDSAAPMGGFGMPIVEDPITLEERHDVAFTCSTKLDLEPMPMLIDDIDDGVEQDYAAWPDRLYLVGRNGKIAYRGGPGPMGFVPDDLEEAIKAELDTDS